MLALFAAEAAVEALFQVKGEVWIHITEMPIVVLASPFLGIKPLIALQLLQPLLHINELFSHSWLNTSVIIGLIYLTSFTLWFVFHRQKRRLQEYKQSFQKLNAEARDIAEGSNVLNDDLILSRYLTDTEEIEKDIQGIISIVERSIAADLVGVFIHKGGELVPWLFTDGKLHQTTGRGMLYSVLQKKKPVIFFPDHKVKKPELGYVTDAELSSFLAIPVQENNITMGILIAESSRYSAFDQNDLKLAEIAAEEIARLMRRQRLFSQMTLTHKGLVILHEESSGLMELLDLTEICKKIIKGAERLSGAKAMLLLKQKRTYTVHVSEGLQIKDNRLTLRGTVLEMSLSNKEPLHLSDTSQFSKSLPPVILDNAKSLLALPILQEPKVRGILVILSDKKGGFSSLQIDLLQVFINQASESIANALLHEEIKMLAFTDGLTGLLNHRRFQETLEVELKRAERFNESLSLILTDIDHFKRVNDTYGHPVGDMVLKGVAELIKKTVREIDIPARYGGEEFAIIVLRADANIALKSAERLRKKVQEKRFTADGKSFNVTLSLGIASYPGDATTREELIERADQALYAAKEGGRNRTVLYRKLSH